MNFKQIAAVAALSAALTPAFAADQTNIDLSSGQATFASTSPVLQGGNDVISFVNLAAGTYNFLLSLSAQNISGLGATLNGTPATVLNSGKFSFASLESSGQSPFTLTLTGTPKTGAIYTGELSVTAVPEPGTYALMIAGLASVGFVARRRKA
jgi:hypothetical protein